MTTLMSDETLTLGSHQKHELLPVRAIWSCVNECLQMCLCLCQYNIITLVGHCSHHLVLTQMVCLITVLLTLLFLLFLPGNTF